MALAEKVLAAQFNQADHNVVDHKTYTFLGDGCLMEGISHEACSLAGTLGLGKLICYYDDNGISIDGEVEGWFTDDTPARFEAYGWQVLANVDGHDPDAIKTATDQAIAETNKPTLICCKTIIGFGSPNKQGTSGVHGAALGPDEVIAARKELAWSHPAFEIPEQHYQAWDAKSRGAELEAEWQQRFDAYAEHYPELAAEYRRRVAGELPADFSAQADAYIGQCQAEGASIASRKASQNCLDAFGPMLPELLGGSADLAGSNNTIWADSKGITAADASGNYIYYGVREFGMSAIMNGMAVHGGFIPYGATFLVFMEYARNAVRMAAIMKQRSILVYTHDSIGLGEDGPTHQPVEQLANLRNTPNLSTWRPCDTVESAVAWKSAIEDDQGPSALIFTRQAMAHQPRDPEQVANIAKGGYVLLAGAEQVDEIDAVIIGTGSELELAVKAAQQLSDEGYHIRVVSMPSTSLFDRQDAAYRESVLPAQLLNRVAVEAAHVDFWYKYVGLDGRIVGMTTFGESAPASDLYTHFGITADAVAEQVRSLIEENASN
jgi:transketolase